MHGTITGGKCVGTVLWRVFFAGTRLSLPNTVFAPPTPLACGSGQYPCRSQFDSIIYALGAVSGQAAYDLNAAGDDAYRIFRDSRIAAITMQADPNPARGGSSFTPDEGLMKGMPKPPPPPGVPPTADQHGQRGLRARAGPAGPGDPVRLDGLPVGSPTGRPGTGPVREDRARSCFWGLLGGNESIAPLLLPRLEVLAGPS